MDASVLAKALDSLEQSWSSLDWWLNFWTILVVIGVGVELIVVIAEYTHEWRDFEAETDDCGAFPPTPITDEWFSYDKDGRTTNFWEYTQNSGSYYPVAASYWPHSMVNTLSGVPGLPTITYTPDYEGRVNTVSASSGQNLVITSGSNPGTSYNSASQITQINLGSGDSDTFSYDQNTGLMSGYQFNVNGQSESGTLTWNGTGTLGKLVITDPFNSSNAQTCTYSHDDLSRISQANCGSAWNQSFAYDAFGNIKATGSGLFQPTYSTTNSNRITQIGSTNVSYDSDGNVLNDTMHSFTWDVYSLPATMDGISITYDALGRMVERNNNGTITQVVYSPTGVKLAIMQGQTLDAGYAPMPGGTVAHYAGTSGTILYRHPNWRGDVPLVSSNTRTVFSDGAFSPFGYPYAGLAYDAFTGMNMDTSSGLYDFPAREYEYQGRWPSPDPAGLTAVDPTNPQSWNRYAYVLNQSTRFCRSDRS
jgi:RHS repeat-associated protein